MLSLKKASEVLFSYDEVSYIRISTDGSIDFMNAPQSKKDKRELVDLLVISKITGAKFIAVLCNDNKTDIFEVDDVNKAIEELELCL